MPCARQPNIEFARASPGSLFGDNPSGWAFGRMGQIHMGRANPFVTLVACLDTEGFLLPRKAVDERRRREDVDVHAPVEAAEAYRTEPGCPGCGARGAWGRLHRGRRPEVEPPPPAAGGSPPAVTILEHRRKPLATSVFFIRLMRHNVPVECAAELCGVTNKTAFEWRHRVLATVSGYQDRIVPCDTAWVDETYINDANLSKGYGQARKRGLSRQ